jgi:ABC-type transport system involved in multi-copper enzyme maturation permease subunit
MSARATGERWLQPGRIGVIAGHTFTHLVRMKVFYFMAIFAVIVIVSNFFNMPYFEGPESVAENELRMLKSASFGAMKLFAVVFAVVATALLLPRDVEDRTLYTILAKPVPRIDYLAGKLLGVLALVAASLLVMDLMMTGVLAFRAQSVLNEQMLIADGRGWPEDVRETVRASVRQHGPTWSLQAGVLAILLQAGVLAAVSLLISTFSTSTLFTAIVSFLVYFIGHLQADARDFWLRSAEGGQGLWGRLASLAAAVILPDFQLFNVVDAAIEGQAIAAAAVGKLAAVSLLYIAVYTVLSWFVFSDKEF